MFNVLTVFLLLLSVSVFADCDRQQLFSKENANLEQYLSQGDYDSSIFLIKYRSVNLPLPNRYKVSLIVDPITVDTSLSSIASFEDEYLGCKGKKIPYGHVYSGLIKDCTFCNRSGFISQNVRANGVDKYKLFEMQEGLFLSVFYNDLAYMKIADENLNLHRAWQTLIMQAWGKQDQFTE